MCTRLFPDDYFAVLYTTSVRGRPTVPARTLATVILEWRLPDQRKAAHPVQVPWRSSPASRETYQYGPGCGSWRHN